MLETGKINSYDILNHFRGAMIAIGLHVKKELKLRDRIEILKQKRIQKTIQMWHDADRVIESLKIESE